jgi:hypothetical protein
VKASAGAIHGKLWSAWYGLVMAGVLGFGPIGERRPFGNDTLAHPLVVYFAAVAVGRLILRVATGARGDL